MMGTFQYRDQFYALCPEWLTTGNAEKYLYVLELSRDALLEKMNQAIRIRIPGLGDASQLPYLAYDRGLVQGLAESDVQFVERLQSAFQTWGLAGSTRAVMLNLQSYMFGLQPGVPATNPLMTVIGGSANVTTWHQLYLGDAIGALPTLTTVRPANFSWDGQNEPWRDWLVLPMTQVATGQSGAAAQTTTAGGGSFTAPGQNVSGVWVPASSGTPVNAPFMHVTGLSGIGSQNVGQWLNLSGSSNPTNNGAFQIVQVLSSASVIIANPTGVASDAGPLTWTIGAYPFIGPGLPYGAPGVIYGQGELSIPPLDTGSNIGGVWQPNGGIAPGQGKLTSWGLNVSANEIASIRALVKTWKSARTYVPNIIIAFDAGTGIAGSAYSPNSAEGSGNPDGSFGQVGSNVNGVWVPTRLITSAFDCYCQGTGTAQSCSVENVS
jgi:hypothetical protein